MSTAAAAAAAAAAAEADGGEASSNAQHGDAAAGDEDLSEQAALPSINAAAPSTVIDERFFLLFRLHSLILALLPSFPCYYRSFLNYYYYCLCFNYY